MNFYLDTNILMSFIFIDAQTTAVETWIGKHEVSLCVGDWVEAEFVSIVNKRIRARAMSAADGASGMADFDAFVGQRARRLPISPAAGARAASLARDPRLKLSAADALHLACASEGGYCLVTGDARLIEAARASGVPVEQP